MLTVNGPKAMLWSCCSVPGIPHMKPQNASVKPTILILLSICIRHAWQCLTLLTTVPLWGSMTSSRSDAMKQSIGLMPVHRLRLSRSREFCSGTCTVRKIFDVIVSITSKIVSLSYSLVPGSPGTRIYIAWRARYLLRNMT